MTRSHMCRQLCREMFEFHFLHKYTYLDRQLYRKSHSPPPASDTRASASRQLYRKMPGFHWLFLNPLRDNDMLFESDRHIANVSVPVMIMHAEDDLIIPYSLAVKVTHGSGGRSGIKSASSYPTRWLSKAGNLLAHCVVCSNIIPAVQSRCDTKSSTIRDECLLLVVQSPVTRCASGVG